MGGLVIDVSSTRTPRTRPDHEPGSQPQPIRTTLALSSTVLLLLSCARHVLQNATIAVAFALGKVSTLTAARPSAPKASTMDLSVSTRNEAHAADGSRKGLLVLWVALTYCVVMASTMSIHMHKTSTACTMVPTARSPTQHAV